MKGILATVVEHPLWPQCLELDETTTCRRVQAKHEQNEVRRVEATPGAPQRKGMGRTDRERSRAVDPVATHCSAVHARRGVAHAPATPCLPCRNMAWHSLGPARQRRRPWHGRAPGHRPQHSSAESVRPHGVCGGRRLGGAFDGHKEPWSLCPPRSGVGGLSLCALRDGGRSGLYACSGVVPLSSTDSPPPPCLQMGSESRTATRRITLERTTATTTTSATSQAHTAATACLRQARHRRQGHRSMARRRVRPRPSRRQTARGRRSRGVWLTTTTTTMSCPSEVWRGAGRAACSARGIGPDRLRSGRGRMESPRTASGGLAHLPPRPPSFLCSAEPRPAGLWQRPGILATPETLQVHRSFELMTRLWRPCLGCE